MGHGMQVEVSGGTLHVARIEGGGPAVLLVHGISSHHMAWVPVVRELLGRFPDVRVLAPDLRGRGASNAIEGYGISRHVDDAVAVLDAAGVASAVVAGHSMGAWVVANLAETHAGRVRHAILVDGAAMRPLSPEVQADPEAELERVLGPAIARLGMTFATPEEYVGFWRAHPAFADGRFNDDVEAYARYDLEGPDGALRSRARPEAVRVDGRDILVGDAVRTAVERVEVPMHLLRAEFGLLHDAPFLSDEAIAAFPGEVTDMPGVNHYTATLGEGAPIVAEAIARRL